MIPAFHEGLELLCKYIDAYQDMIPQEKSAGKEKRNQCISSSSRKGENKHKKIAQNKENSGGWHFVLLCG